MKARFTPAEQDYYARQTVLAEVGADGQARLRAARALVVGAGGLGCPALQYLAGAGVGHIGIRDGDRLEASNLHRQPLYRYEDIGEYKAHLAARSIGHANPYITVTARAEDVTHANAAELIADYDVVLDCTDNFEAKYLLNDTAVAAGKPLVQASIHQYEGHLLVVNPAGGGPCLRCLWPAPPPTGCIASCAEAGVLGAVPGVFGAWQAMETLKLLLGFPTYEAPGLVTFDLLGGGTRRLRAARDAGCPACGNVQAAPPARPAVAIDVDLDWDAAMASGLYVVDMREEPEREAQPLPAKGVLPWPLSQVGMDGAPFGRETRCLLCCARGMRSRYIARQLRAMGYAGVYSLAGGAAALRKRNHA